MFSRFSSKHVSTFFVGLSFFLASSVAEGVTAAQKNIVDESEDVPVQVVDEGLHIGIVARADADIQIRRIKTMMSTKKTDAEKEIEQLEKFQKILRGEN